MQNRISRNLCVLFKAEKLLDFKTLLKLYYSFIHTYLNFGNITCTSTNKIKLKNLYNQQKHALRITFNKNKLDSVSYLFNEIKAFNIFKINIFQTLIFMFKTKNQLNPAISAQKLLLNKILNKTKGIAHQYPTRFSKHCFYGPNRKTGLLKSARQTNNTQCYPLTTRDCNTNVKNEELKFLEIKINTK